MQETSTSRGPGVTRRAYDQVQAKTLTRARPRLLPAALLLCLGVAVNLHGQQLPPDPGAVGSQSSSSITGTVRDGRGLPLVGIEARVLGQNNPIDAKRATDNNGVFTFTDLPAGVYQVKVDVAGLQPFASEPLAIAAGTRHELPAVVMRMVTKTTTINVNASSQEVAEAQVKQEEKQRLLGVLPNYYTSYIWDAAPMTSSDSNTHPSRCVSSPPGHAGGADPVPAIPAADPLRLLSRVPSP